MISIKLIHRFWSFLGDILGGLWWSILICEGLNCGMVSGALQYGFVLVWSVDANWIGIWRGTFLCSGQRARRFPSVLHKVRVLMILETKNELLQTDRMINWCVR